MSLWPGGEPLEKGLFGGGGVQRQRTPQSCRVRYQVRLAWGSCRAAGLVVGSAVTGADLAQGQCGRDEQTSWKAPDCPEHFPGPLLCFLLSEGSDEPKVTWWRTHGWVLGSGSGAWSP